MFRTATLFSESDVLAMAWSNNFYTAMASGKKDKVPITTTIGCAFHPRSNISMVLDIRKMEDLRATAHFGVEGWINEFVAARGGLDDGDLCLGSSFRWGRWLFDYGFQDHDMGDIHRISGTLRFDFP